MLNPRLYPLYPTLELLFGRNSAPQGSFWEFFGSSKARSRCATFVQPRLPMVQPPASTIHDLLVLGALGGTERNFTAPKLAKNAQKWIFPDLGAVLG